MVIRLAAPKISAIHYSQRVDGEMSAFQLWTSYAAGGQHFNQAEYIGGKNIALYYYVVVAELLGINRVGSEPIGFPPPRCSRMPPSDRGLFLVAWCALIFRRAIDYSVSDSAPECHISSELVKTVDSSSDIGNSRWSTQYSAPVRYAPVVSSTLSTFETGLKPAGNETDDENPCSPVCRKGIGHLTLPYAQLVNALLVWFRQLSRQPHRASDA